MIAHGNDLADRLLNAKEAARYLGYTEGTVRNKASDGTLPSVKLGFALRFRRSDLDRWIEEQNEKSRAEKRDAGPAPESDR